MKLGPSACLSGDAITGEVLRSISSHLALTCVSTHLLSDRLWLDVTSLIYMQINTYMSGTKGHNVFYTKKETHLHFTTFAESTRRICQRPLFVAYIKILLIQQHIEKLENSSRGEKEVACIDYWLLYLLNVWSFCLSCGVKLCLFPLHQQQLSKCIISLRVSGVLLLPVKQTVCSQTSAASLGR